jgi:hypothetical protein
MKPEDLIEFRTIYTTLFGTKKYIEITQAVLDSPLYSRYKVLAPIFYQMMFQARKKHGLKV